MERGCGKIERISGDLNKLVFNNGFTRVVSGPKIGDTFLYISLLRSKYSFISCNILPGISDHKGVYWKQNGMKFVGSQMLEDWFIGNRMG